MSTAPPFENLDIQTIEETSAEQLDAITAEMESFYGDGAMTAEHSRYYRRLCMYDYMF
jgi:hypothetical protein